MAVTASGITSGTGTLTAAGVGSGLDVKGLVSQLMAVEQQPLTLLATKEASFQSQLTSLGSVSGAMSTLQTAAQSLVSASAAAYGASASDSSVLTATAAGNAVPGSYAIAVTSLAQQQKLVTVLGQSSTTVAIGASVSTTLTFQLGTISGGTLVNGIYSPVATFVADPVKPFATVAIDSTNNTLAGIRDAINAANTGVTATIINDGSSSPYRLSLTSNDTGAASSLKLTVAGDGNISTLLSYDASTTTQNLTQTQVAQDAKFSVDGVNITAAKNVVTDAIQGVTLNLAKASPTSPATSTVTVQRDTSGLTAALNALVQSYNSVNQAISSVTAKGAVLQGDWAVLGLERQVRTILGGAQSGGTYTTLSQLGITFQRGGSLALDSSKLTAALSTNVGDVASLTMAIGTAIKSAADNLLGTTGPLANETGGINRSIKDIGSRRTVLQARLDATQARYQAQFSALDTLLSSMNSTSTFLTQQLGNLPNYYNTKG
jgi:flagellar hook-associated protein 2